MVKINSPKAGSPYDHTLIAMKNIGELKVGDTRKMFVCEFSDKRFGVMTSFGLPHFYKCFDTKKEMDEAFNEQLSIV